MLWVGFEPTIPVFERAKTFHTLDRAAIVIGRPIITHSLYKTKKIVLPIILLTFISSCSILSRVYGSVTNNNGFWIGWLDLMTASFTITRNRDQLQELTINLQPNSSSLTDEDSPHSLSLLFDSVLYYLYGLKANPYKTHPLPSNGYMRTT
jgi:hypothetical protein